MKKNGKVTITKKLTVGILALMTVVPIAIFSESVAEKASDKKNEVIHYLRSLRPMVYNFPCEPFPDCIATVQPINTSSPNGQTTGAQTGATTGGQTTGTQTTGGQTTGGQTNQAGVTLNRIRLYEDVKRVYQEGLIYLYEGNYINAYNRFLESQMKTEEMLESLSQAYIDRTEEMMRAAIEKKHPDDPMDMAVVDISIEFGPQSKMRRDFKIDRVAPNDNRRYDERQYHYVMAKYDIEQNMKMGYEQLGLAREARLKALMVDNNLTAQQTVQPHHRKMRIELYIRTIEFCRQAKRNAEYIYQLKYPYDNYALMNLPDNFTNPRKLTDQNKIDEYLKTHPGEFTNDLYEVDVAGRDASGNPITRPVTLRVPSVENRRMNWYRNPYIFPEQLHPIFDLRLPQIYRRDAVDVRNMVYVDEIDANINFKYYKVKPSHLFNN